MNNRLKIVLVIFCCLNAFGREVKVADKNRTKSQLPTAETISAKNNTPISEEEYKVYAVILRKEKGALIIKDKTDIDKDSKNIKLLEQRGFEGFFLKKVNSETMTDFLEKNEKSNPLGKKFPPDIEFNFISNEELKAKFTYKFDGEMNWESFREKYPKAGNIYTLSRVGFSQDGSQALLFVTNWCGNICGEGNYYILKKENDNWKIVDKIMTWIS